MTMRSSEVLEALETALRQYDGEAAERWARESVARGIDPLLAFDAMSNVVHEFGDRFESGDCWLPELIAVSDAMQKAVPVLEEQIRRQGSSQPSRRRAVTGSVHGDIHSIGIEMVSALLTGAGFDVRYLGVDVDPEAFVAAVKEHHADILCMSALLTVTALEQKKVIELLQSEGMRDAVKVMVGGGAVTADFALKIGADGFDSTASGAVRIAESLMDLAPRPQES